MSSHLQAAMQLYARTQDRLSHVLVNPIFESKVRDAFFPTRPASIFHYDEIVHGADGKQIEKRSISSDDMQIDLGYVDFIPLRDGLPKVLQDRKFSAQEANRIARAAFDRPMIEIDLIRRSLTIAGIVLRPPEKAFWGYAWLCWRNKVGGPPIDLAEIVFDFERFKREWYPFAVGPKPSDDKGKAKHNSRLTNWANLVPKKNWIPFFDEPWSRFANEDLDQIGPTYLARYRVKKAIVNEKYGIKRRLFHVDLPPACIRFTQNIEPINEAHSKELILEYADPANLQAAKPPKI